MTSFLRTLGYLALGTVPLAYAQVPYLPILLRSLPLLASGAAFALALAGSTGKEKLSPTLRQVGLLSGFWLAFQALSSFWGEPRWAALTPVLNTAASLTVACGIATDPHRNRGLALAGLGTGAALTLYAANLLMPDTVETWIHGMRIPGEVTGHLPFGNPNTAALLVSACLPAAIWGAWHALPSRQTARTLAWSAATILLAWLLWRTQCRGAVIGLAGGACLLLAFRTARKRSTTLLSVLVLLAIVAAPPMAAWSLSRLPQPPRWQLTTTFGIRTLIWESALNAWRTAPWLGHGSGSFPLLFPHCRAEAYPLSLYAQPLTRHAYNLPLQTLAETGLIGALLGVAALIALWASWRQGPGGWPLWTAGTLMTQALGGDALNDPLGLACFALAAALALPLPGTGMSTSSHPWRWIWSLLALPLAGACLLGALQAKAFAKAHVAARTGDLIGAETEFARAAWGPPCLISMDARFERGVLLMHLGRDREALEAFRDLLEKAGPYGNARPQAALAALATGDRDDRRTALAWLEGHLAFNPCDLKARRLLAELDPERLPRLQTELTDLVGKLPAGHPMLKGEGP